MWLKLDLNGIDFHFQIKRYQKNGRKDWDSQWCSVEVTLQSYKWLDFHTASDILLSSEVDRLRDSIDGLLNNSLSKQFELTFIEPDLTFVLNPQKNTQDADAYSKIDYEKDIIDVSGDLIVHLWNGGLTANHISLRFDRPALEKLLIYLRLITKDIQEQATEVRELINNDIIR